MVQRVKKEPLGDPRLDGEEYSASFGRSRHLGEFSARCDEVLKPALGGLLGEEITDLDLRIHRMVAGDYLRAHVDQNLGSYGFTVTLSKTWKLDWGGLLIVVDGETEVFCPRFNELVVVGSETPHFVTEVSKYALEDRLTLVGFAKCA